MKITDKTLFIMIRDVIEQAEIPKACRERAFYQILETLENHLECRK